MARVQDGLTNDVDNCYFRLQPLRTESMDTCRTWKSYLRHTSPDLRRVESSLTWTLGQTKALEHLNKDISRTGSSDRAGMKVGGAHSKLGDNRGEAAELYPNGNEQRRAWMHTTVDATSHISRPISHDRAQNSLANSNRARKCPCFQRLMSLRPKRLTQPWGTYANDVGLEGSNDR